MKYYIGVDGGGTKTAFALFNENKEMLEYIEGPGSRSCRGPVRFHSFFCMIQFGSIHVRIRYFCFGRPTLP